MCVEIWANYNPKKYEPTDLQRYSSKIGDIITEQTNSEDITFNQLLSASKKMALDFYDMISNQWITLNDGNSRNVRTGKIKSNEDLLSDFLKNYLIRS
tara:strand:- start:349 stop:642 length:294 start_codon:yes stop_codon:yes gene_type:complete